MCIHLSLLLWSILLVSGWMMIMVQSRELVGHCAMYGQCGGKTSSIFAPPLNCPTHRKAVEPTSAHRARLLEVCGEAFRDRPVCCDIAQLDALQAQTKIVYNVVSACPACWHNFITFFCEFTCSPNQATFMNVTATQISPITGKKIVTEADIFVDPSFGEGFYNSCKDVKFPSDNSFVMNLIGGGAKDYHSMLKYMGTERVGGSPFQLNFPLQSPPKPMIPLQATLKECNTSDTTSRCSCVDCDNVCPLLDDLPGEKDQCRVGRLSCWTFTLVVAYLLITVTVGGAILGVRSGLLRRDTAEFEPVPLSSEEVVQLSADQRSYYTSESDTGISGLNLTLQRWFYHLGFFCASHPWKVIFLTLLFVGITSSGWAYFQVDTAPEKLWVGPKSQVAREKAFFDKNFSPFYRTEQIIITADKTATDKKVVTERHLRLLFQLHKAVSELSVVSPNQEGINITLDDLCLKPTGEGCVVQSVTGYWGNDERRFQSATWLSHFKSCTNQPAGCLPDFQQPIKPDLVLGGFQDENYEEAEAFFITYVLRNSQDQETLARIIAWEEKFVELMQHIHHRFNLTDIRVDFSSEVSI
jgi:Niemann-Pick C1 protein